MADNLMMLSAEENRALAASIDDWRRNQPDLPSRSEAIRRLVEKALEPSRA